MAHRVCLFTDTLGDLNGVSRFIQDMGALAAEDPSLDLHLVTSTLKPLPNAPWIHNLPWRIRWPMPFYQEMDLVWPHRKRIRELLNTLAPDSVHISTPGPFGWAAKNLAQSQGLPMIGTYHTDFPAYLRDLTHSQWIKRKTDKTMRHFYKDFQHVFSRSKAYETIMHTDIEMPETAISTLPAGTRLDTFHPQFRDRSIWQTFGLSSARRKLLYVGRINIEKGVPFLIQAWQSCRQQYGDLGADLVLVGEGRFRKWAPKLEKDHIFFTGPIRGHALSMVYASADLFVFPSVTDTLGQVVMEALASGTGCLVSDQGGPQTLIHPNQTGQVLPALNKTAWAQAFYQALTCPNLLNEWAQAARPSMLDFDIQHSFASFKAQHQQLTDPGSAKPTQHRSKGDTA